MVHWITSGLLSVGSLHRWLQYIPLICLIISKRLEEVSSSKLLYRGIFPKQQFLQVAQPVSFLLTTLAIGNIPENELT